MQLESEEIKMTCKKCGKEVFSGDLFCENCGEKVSTETTEAKQPSAFENFMNKIKSDKKTRNIGLAVLGGLIVIIIAIAIFASACNTLVLSDYILNVSAEGLNGYGKVTYKFDENRLYEDVFGTNPEDSFDYILYDKCTELYNCIKIEDIEGDGTLSNGDKITIKITFEKSDKNFGKTIKSGEYTYEIKGLKEVTKIDAFKDIDIQFEGIGGDARIIINNNSTDEFVKKCSYSADKTNDINNGDKITVTCKYDEEYALEQGCVPEKITKEITVSGLKSYVTDANEITDDIVNKVATYFINFENEDYDGYGTFSRGKVEFHSAYFQIETDENFSRYVNKLIVYIHYKEYKDGAYWRDVYLPIEYKNVVKDENGKIEITLEDGSHATFSDDIDASLKKLNEDTSYTTIKIK